MYYEAPAGSSTTSQAILCGGWKTTNVSASAPRRNFLAGEYFNTCERMLKSNNWDKTVSMDLVRHRAFFSMAAAGSAMYAFGG